MAISEAEKKARRNKQRKESAITAFQGYFQSNASVLLDLSTADVEYTGDLLARLKPAGKLPRISARLRSAGVNRQRFGVAVSEVIDEAQDKIVQPGQRRLIARNLWTIFSKD